MATSDIDFDSEWRRIQAGIDKVVSIVDAGCPNNRDIGGELAMNVHHAVYNLSGCWGKLVNGTTYDKEVYRRYKEFFENYVHTKSLQSKLANSDESIICAKLKKMNVE